MIGILTSVLFVAVFSWSFSLFVSKLAHFSTFTWNCICLSFGAKFGFLAVTVTQRCPFLLRSLRGFSNITQFGTALGWSCFFHFGEFSPSIARSTVEMHSVLSV